MATPFASRDAKLSGAIDRTFGETFTILPFSVAAGGDVNLPKTSDGSRQAFITTAVWDGPAKSSTPHARGATSDDTAHNWAASLPSISVADENLLWAPQPGDRVLRAFDTGLYEISRALPDGMGRTILKLTARKR